MTVALLLIAALAVGCNKDSTTSQQIEKARTNAEEAAKEMKDYTYAQKAQFVEYMQGRLAALNHDLDQLAAKVEKSSDAARAEAAPKIQALREQAAKLNKQLDEVKNSTESTWDGVKAGAKKGLDDLKDGFNQARQWLSDKIAP